MPRNWPTGQWRTIPVQSHLFAFHVSSLSIRLDSLESRIRDKQNFSLSALDAIEVRWSSSNGENSTNNRNRNPCQSCSWNLFSEPTHRSAPTSATCIIISSFSIAEFVSEATPTQWVNRSVNLCRKIHRINAPKGPKLEKFHQFRIFNTYRAVIRRELALV